MNQRQALAPEPPTGAGTLDPSPAGPSSIAGGLFQQIRLWGELVRFSHTVFALPFALLAALLAWTTPADPPAGFRWRWLAGILVSMVAARTAAMAFNRIVDRRFDAVNPRTSRRHLPAGSVTLRSALVLLAGSAILFVAGTLVFLPNWLPIAGAVPVLAVLLGYSYAKRFTSLSHVWLGFALGLAPVCVWVAIRGEQVLDSVSDLVPALLLGAGVMTWVSGFDIIYACQDEQFDRQSGLHSIPAAVGTAMALRVAAAFHLVTVLAFAAVLLSQRLGGPETGLGWIWLVATAAVAGLLAVEHRLVRPGDLNRVNTAFFHVNAVVSIGLLLAGTVDLLVL